MERYIFDYPNLEVKNSFSKLILEANYNLNNETMEEVNNIYEKVAERDIEGVIK